jgi:two-component system response regulator
LPGEFSGKTIFVGSCKDSLAAIMANERRGQKAPGESMDLDIRILLVEDNFEDAAVTKRVLMHNKLNRGLTIATSGKDAIAALQNKSKTDLPQLILLDINLPDISGIDLLKRIKKDEELQDIPVVILTGSNEDQDIQKSYDLGAGSYLVKPISNSALMLVIEKLFYP